MQKKFIIFSYFVIVVFHHDMTSVVALIGDKNSIGYGFSGMVELFLLAAMATVLISQ